MARHTPLTWLLGGKAKPLKQAKKATKELDEEDQAFHDKKRAGTICLFSGGRAL